MASLFWSVRGPTLPGLPSRVVSLVPSVTESLHDLGTGQTVVGVTDYCIFPAEIPNDVLRVGGTKNPDVSRIKSLGPDLVYMNLEENLLRHAEQIERFTSVIVCEPKTVDHVLEMLTMFGRLHERVRWAEEWISRIRVEVPSGSEPSFRFACPIWKDPWMWCGGDTYVSNLIATAGGRNVLEDLSRYPKLDPEVVISREPDLIFLPDEPFLFTEVDAQLVRSWSNAHVVGPFPGHLLTWHGTRTLQGLGFLRQQLASL